MSKRPTITRQVCPSGDPNVQRSPLYRGNWDVWPLGDAAGAAPRALPSPNAPRQVPRSRRRRLAPALRGAHRLRRRQRRWRGRDRSGSRRRLKEQRRARRRAGTPRAARGLDPQQAGRTSSRPRASRASARPSRISSRRAGGFTRLAAWTPTRPGSSCSRTTASSQTGSRIRAMASSAPIARRSESHRPRRRSRGFAAASTSRTGRLARRRCAAPESAGSRSRCREGRNRQVRRMAEAVGNEIVSLKRIRFGSLGPGSPARRRRPQARRGPGEGALEGFRAR